MTLQKPKFKFNLFLIDIEKRKSEQVICFADTFEVVADGSIVFYHIAVFNEKASKIPVLSYPKGKWEGCVLIDDNNLYPVFKTSLGDNKHNNTNYSQTSVQYSYQKDNSRNNSNTPQTQPQNQNVYTPLNNNNIAGITEINNPQEYKKQKTDLLEKNIIEFIKNNEFELNQFLIFVNNDSASNNLKINENDVIWAASNLIKNRVVPFRKFSNPIIQKQLELILPNIMKRLWDGKMSPILTTLQEKEETKDVNAIDLAVWMAKNGFEE